MENYLDNILSAFECTSSNFPVVVVVLHSRMFLSEIRKSDFHLDDLDLQPEYPTKTLQKGLSKVKFCFHFILNKKDFESVTVFINLIAFSNHL